MPVMCDKSTSGGYKSMDLGADHDNINIYELLASSDIDEIEDSGNKRDLSSDPKPSEPTKQAAPEQYQPEMDHYEELVLRLMCYNTHVEQVTDCITALWTTHFKPCGTAFDLAILTLVTEIALDQLNRLIFPIEKACGVDNAFAVFCANMPSWNRTMLTHIAYCTAKDKDYLKCIPYLKNREMPPLHPDAPQAASDHWNLVVAGFTETQADRDTYLVQYLNESNLALGSLSAASGRHSSIPDSHQSFKQSDTVFMYPRNLVGLMTEFVLTMFWNKRFALIFFFSPP